MEYKQSFDISFNSLQTGRTFRTKRKKSVVMLQGWQVSIPFKREGLSEQMKTYSFFKGNLKVSIPFKREGLSELLTTTI